MYNWDQYFMTIAYLTSMMSPDPSTKVGAVCVTKDNALISVGYNFISESLSKKYQDYKNKELRRNLFVHAEEAALLNSQRQCRQIYKIYVNRFPCIKCARSIINTVEQELIYDINFIENTLPMSDKRKNEINMIFDIFHYAGKKIRGFQKPLININEAQ